MTAADLRIQKITQENAIDASGKVVNSLVVTFMVGTHGPFTEKFDKATFNPSTITQTLTDFANKLAQLPGSN